MDKKYLIINADDFGSCYGSNEATEILFNLDCITSCTLMVTCAWAEDGIIRAKNNPKMKVGLHTTLTAEWDCVKWGPVSRGNVSSLLDKNGYFFAKCSDLLESATQDAIFEELEAQINWMLSRGYEPTHIDNHMGSLYGTCGKPYVKEALDFCSKYNKPFRLPRNISKEMWPVSDELIEMQKQADQYAKHLNVPILDYLLSYNFPSNKDDSYETIKSNYIKIINNIKPGVSELFMHPMVDTPDGRASVSSWQMRKWEFKVLQDDDFKRAIKDNGITLIGWEDIKNL